MQLLLEAEREARSPVGSVETLQSSMFTTVATVASPAKHSSGSFWTIHPLVVNSNTPPSRRAVNWQNKNNRTFQCKFENKCEITIKNRKTCQSCRFQVIRAIPLQLNMI